MSTTRVAVIGAGVAGPILAIFLKLKGYVPILYERNDETPSTGLGLGLVLRLRMQSMVFLLI